MVWKTKGEQRLRFNVHNHTWIPEDFDGITLIRRPTEDARKLRKARAEAKGDESVAELGQATRGNAPKNWSNAAKRRRYPNAVEKRHGVRTPHPGQGSESFVPPF
jgi:hypothetical protein